MGSSYSGIDNGTTNSVRSTADVGMGDVNAAANEAHSVGRQLKHALSTSATPQVNNAQQAATLRLMNAIKAGLSGIGGLAA